MPGDYLSSVARILDRGTNTNSYKFALLRTLIRLTQSPESAAIAIGRGHLAEEFVRLYWPLTLRFKIRQATVPDKDPVVMRLIREAVARCRASEDIELRRFQKDFAPEYSRLIQQVASAAFNDVIPRFHKVARQTVEPRLYDVTGGGISIHPDVQRFLQANEKVLDLLAVGAWVKFTEKFTSAPRLYEKIQGLPPRRSSLKYYADYFAEAGVSDCFYCGVELDQNGHIDHFIPWRFVAEDKVWNLVLACASCNSQKSSLTPNDRYANKLLQRNDQLLAADPNDLPKKVRNDLVELRGRVPGEHVRMFLDACRADGFGIWSPRIIGDRAESRPIRR